MSGLDQVNVSSPSLSTSDRSFSLGEHVWGRPAMSSFSVLFERILPVLAAAARKLEG
jgi:hypothetical protein